MKSKYFSNANNFANENFSNYGGWSSMTPTSFMNADAGVVNAGVGQSEPLNFDITNAGTVKISDVVLLGGYENTANGVNNYGNDDDITISMDNGSIDYPTYLQAVKNEAFSVGQIYLASDTAAQITRTITVTYKESNGKESKILINPKIDPMQNQLGALIQRTQFPINGYTKLSFDMLASASLSIALYPMVTLDPANQLVGKSAATSFTAPNLSQFRLG